MNVYMTLSFSSAPASPPENVQTDVISSTEIRVSWTEVSAIHRNGIITMYEVMYEPLMTFDGQLQTNTSIANNTSVILPDLQEYVNYSISVRAYTREGPSNYSEEVIAGTSEDGNLTEYMLTSIIQNVSEKVAVHKAWEMLDRIMQQPNMFL